MPWRIAPGKTPVLCETRFTRDITLGLGDLLPFVRATVREQREETVMHLGEVTGLDEVLGQSHTEAPVRLHLQLDEMR